MHKSKDLLVSELMAQILEQTPATHSLDLAFNVCACRVYSNSEAMVSKLQRHYLAFKTMSVGADFLITVVETPPVVQNTDYSLTVPGHDDLVLATRDLDWLDERHEYAPNKGLLTLRSASQTLIVGPCQQHTDAVIRVIYDQYQSWSWRRQAKYRLAHV